MSNRAVITHAYGPGPAQFGELHLPAGATRPGVVVVIHGGFWRSAYDLSLGTPLAADLAARGVVAWNLEYRRVGNGHASDGGAGGGWPATFADVAAGIDALADLAVAHDLDLSSVVAVGHSAGGHLAVWAAGREGLPEGTPGAAPRVRLTGALSQAGVLDLTGGAQARVGHGAIPDLLGGLPDAAPARYALADPMRAVPLEVPVVCLHSRADNRVPYEHSVAYVTAASSAGARARLVETRGDHFTLIDPQHADWATAREQLSALLA